MMFPYTGGNISAQQFRYAYKNVSNGTEPTYHAASALACLYALHAAIIFGQSTNPNVTMQSFSWLTRGFGLRTFWGYLGFNSVGQMDESDDFSILQYGEDTSLQVITPVRIATAKLVFPSPTFPERTCEAIVPECGNHGVCVSDGSCSCWSPYSGSACTSQINTVQLLLQSNGCQGWWIAALVLLVIFIIAFVTSIICCYLRQKAKKDAGK
jgi:hypothetical protein